VRYGYALHVTRFIRRALRSYAVTQLRILYPTMIYGHATRVRRIELDYSLSITTVVYTYVGCQGQEWPMKCEACVASGHSCPTRLCCNFYELCYNDLCFCLCSSVENGQSLQVQNHKSSIFTGNVSAMPG